MQMYAETFISVDIIIVMPTHTKIKHLQLNETSMVGDKEARWL